MTVQSLSTTIDQFGGEVKAWSDRYIDVWCQPLPIGSSAAGGGEYNDDSQMQADTKYEFVSRYLPGVEYTDRIYWSGGYFDIYQIFPIGRREGVRIRASWSDDQGDAFAMGSLGAQQAVAGTGGLTLAEVTAQYESNDTGQTFDQLVTFYNDTISAGVPEIYYQRPQHKHEWETVLGPANYPFGYAAKHAAGDLNPPQPAAISHVAEIDYTADLRGKTLTHNNEFGNKHRFTYDDGVEATEINSNNRTYVQGGRSDVGPGADGYTGTNPQYIIDHLTGLGWHRTYNHSAIAALNNEWWEGSNPKSNLAGATSFHSYFEAADALTLDGHSDWRVATLQEVIMGYGGPTDNSNAMTADANTDTDMYFPPLNGTLRESGTRVNTLGPIDYNTKTEDQTPLYIGWPGFGTNSTVSLVYTDAQMEAFFTGTRNDTGMFPLVRKHY